MISNEVKERLLQKDWYVECKTKKDTDLVLQACDDAEITWLFGDKATECKPCDYYPVDIGFCKEDEGLTHSATYYKKSEIENITDWFFNAIKNNDRKLTPQNAEQEHWVQIILARLQGIPLETYLPIGKKWTGAGDDCAIFMNYEYRIKSKPTPIPVSRKIWKKINKEFPFLIMDKNEHFYHCKKAPKRQHGEWNLAEVEHIKSPLMFNADGINWETSLTERPEDV